jgi:ribonuclease BN (tRNA processing enzyme)
MKMIKIYPLGVNGAFTKYYHNNYVFQLGNNRKLLVDAGTTLRNSLPESGFKETDITDIIITHLHSDHVGGLEEFAQRCKWIYNHRPNLLIRKDLAGGLSQILSSGLCTDGLKLSDYFNIQYVDYKFLIEDYRIDLIYTDNLHAENMLSMGLKITDIQEKKNVIFTSDIAKHEKAEFDEYIDQNTTALLHDISLVPNAVHSYIDDVIEYYKDKIELNYIFGMHYQDDANLKELKKKYGIEFMERNEVYYI